MDAIRTHGLSKRYPAALAVDAIDLSVPEGSVYGFLGPIGAGKSTTLRLLAGLVRPTSGGATILGCDVARRAEAQRRIGYLPGEVRLYDDLTGAQNLLFLERLHPSPPVQRAALLDRFQMGSAVLARKAGTYSRGLRQAVALVATFQHDPLLYLLDEPTTGLDPLMRAALVDLLESEARRGKTIFLSSHVLTEVERTCDRIAFIRAGRLIFEGSLADARERTLRRLEVAFTRPMDVDWHSVPEVVEVQGTPRRHLVFFRGKPGGLLRLLAGLPIEDLNLSSASLEETFLLLYQRESA